MTLHIEKRYVLECDLCGDSLEFLGTNPRFTKASEGWYNSNKRMPLSSATGESKLDVCDTCAETEHYMPDGTLKARIYEMKKPYPRKHPLKGEKDVVA